MGVAITGWGRSLPRSIVTNEMLAEHLDVDPAWIYQRTGIRERRIATTETTTMLGTDAARAALRVSGTQARSLDAVIVATVTPDMGVPATASLIQHALGATRAAAFDLNAGCSGFVYALAQASCMCRSRQFSKVAVIGADVLSKITDRTDPRTAPLFGDGAGAAIVENVTGDDRIGSFLLGSDGAEPELLYLDPSTRTLRMEGKEVYRRAVDRMARSVEEACAREGCSVNDIDLFVMHQANARILDAVAERLCLDPTKVPSNIAKVGNTSAASIPLVLTEAASEGRLSAGARVAMGAFGAGFTWAAGVVRWGTWETEVRAQQRDRVTAHA